MKRITSTELSNWAPRSCQDNLPLLIRKLIRASAINVINLLIPAGDNIILPGYDGTLECIKGTDYIPSGKSVWEIGSGKDFRKKANDDFRKRTKAISETEIEETTFVFVTPHVWSGKEAWIKTKRKSSKWKEISVIDGLALEEWIELHSSVEVWLAKLLQSPFGNVKSLEEFWQIWSKNIQYRIPATLVTSGREEETKQLHTYFSGSPNLLSIKAFSLEEVIAFIGASVERMEDDLKEEIYSKAIIIENEQDFELISANKTPMLLIAKFEAGNILDHAVANGHHVILPLGNDVTAADAQIELPRIKRQGFEQGLKEMGFEYEEAEKLINDSGQSLSVFRRLLDFERNQQPAWAKGGHHTDILPALLIGRWNEEKEADKTILSLLAEESYEKYTTRLSRWKLEKDSPFIQIKSIWRLTSALDAWSILFRFVTQSNLDNFRTVFLKVIAEINPGLELEPDKRYLASLYGKEAKFSYSLKEGLCQSLILIAVFGDQFKLVASSSSQGFADNIIYTILFEAKGETWCSLYRLLPLLSEASPDSFLRAVENSLAKENPPVMEMFGEIYDPFSSVSYYTGLLWALENLLFSEEYFSRTVLILSRLSQLDPGGKLANRPINTLKQVFTPWYRQTKADIDLKKSTLDKITEMYPDVAWEILQSCTPKTHAVASPIHKCKWRFDTQYLKREVTYQEIWDFNSYVFGKLLLLANKDENKIASLIDLYPYLIDTDKEKLVSFLKDSHKTIEHADNLVWNELRDLIARQKRNKEQHRVLPEDELIKLEEIYELYTPTNLYKKHQYLFEMGWISIPGVMERTYNSLDERHAVIDDLRKRAFDDISQTGGLSDILRLVDRLKNPSSLARIASRYKLAKKEEKKILDLLYNNSNSNRKSFAQQYIFHKALVSEKKWILWALNYVKSKSLTEEVYSDFFLSLPQTRENMELVETLSNGVSKLYWQKVNFHLFGDNAEDRIWGIEKLQAVNRHVTVLNEISYFVQEIPTEIICNALSKAVLTKAEEEIRVESYNVGVIFNELYSRNDLEEEKIVQLEWSYIPVLCDNYNVSKPKFLHHKLSTSPEFFVEVVSYVYLADKESGTKELSESEMTQWFRTRNLVRELLESWRTIPGTKEDRTIDKDELQKWISAARAKAKDVNRVRGVNCEIGNLLACFPRTELYWPPDEICEVIDALNNRDVNTHFEVEIFNSRGVTVRSAYEGGNQEKVLADYFGRMGKQILSKYPVTASILLGLAKNYMQTSKVEDEDAYLDELR